MTMKCQGLNPRLLQAKHVFQSFTLFPWPCPRHHEFHLLAFKIESLELKDMAHYLTSYHHRILDYIENIWDLCFQVVNFYFFQQNSQSNTMGEIFYETVFPYVNSNTTLAHLLVWGHSQTTPNSGLQGLSCQSLCSGDPVVLGTQPAHREHDTDT